MRKVVLPVGNSVDNYIATNDGGVDWLVESDEANAMLEEMWKTVDAVVMGRKTYEFAAAHGMEPFADVDVYVLSNTLKSNEHKDVTVVSEDTAAFIQTLKKNDGGDIWLMCGSDIAGHCLKHGLIDELHLNVHPVLLGNGASLFPELDESVDLELLECRPLPHGCVSLSYRVKS